MHEYDIALKVLLQASTASVLRQVAGVNVTHWLNTEMPQVQTSRVDLLGVAADGRLIHIELQSSNDPNMALRMAEYALRIYRQFGKFPLQIVLYVGEAPLRMAASMAEPDAVNPDFSYRYTLLDIRDLDAVTLLASSHIEDNLLAILTRLPDRLDTIRQILFRIAGLEPPARQAAFARFLIISGLRRLAPAVREEAQKMPILNDILDHEVIGPAILKGRQEGRQEGLQEGRQELLQRQLEKRFGPLPTWVIARLSGLSSIELDDVAVRLLESARLEQLFPEKQ